MSSRALKKLGKNDLEAELAKYSKKTSNLDVQDEDESSGEETFQPKANNAFAFLANDSDDSESDDYDINDVDSDSEKINKTADIKKDTKAVSVFKKKKKNSKKSQNKAAKKVQNGLDDLDDDELDKLLAKVKLEDKSKRFNNQTSMANPGKKNTNNNNYEDYDEEEDDDDDDIFYSDMGSGDSDSEDNEADDVTLPAWPIYTTGGKLLTPQKFNKCCHLLQIDYRDLNPDKEYENLFGKLSSAAIDDADSTSSTAISPEVLESFKKIAKRIRGWSGRDHRSIPGTSKKLKLTKIRNDWIPIPKKPLSLDQMSKEDLLNLNTSKFKEDWKDILLDDIKTEHKYGIKYYNLNPGPTYSHAATTEFFMSVVVQPDHDSLIRLLQKSPYSLETLLQVACIIQRQGDNSNTNGLIERALFIFDWSLPNSFELGDGKSRLPFEYFYNRQVYLTIFRYISVLTQKSTFFTALTYCKLLLSFNPADDPYGVRYFIDFYAFVSGEYQFLIDFIDSPLCRCYEEWLTASLLYTRALCYYKLGKIDEAKEALKYAYSKHPYTGHLILENVGDISHPWLLADVTDTVKLVSAIYTVRLNILVEESPVKNFILKELALVIESVGKPNMSAYYWNNLEKIPENVLRYAVLSNESSVMAKIPESFWSNNDIYEFDVLPPSIGTTVYNYIDDNQISNNVMQDSMRAEEIRQLQDLLQQNIIEER